MAMAMALAMALALAINSEPELELHDILDWLARYTDTTIDYKENNPQNC